MSGDQEMYQGEPVLKGERYKYSFGDDNWYLAPFGDNSGFLEMWSTVPNENKPEMQRARSNIQYMSAVIQVALEHGVDPLVLIDAGCGAITEMAPKDACEAVLVNDAVIRFAWGGE